MSDTQSTDVAGEATNPANRFALTVGWFMQHCGTLELLVNGAIRAFGTDKILSSAASKAPLKRRIEILGERLHMRSDLASGAIDALCDDLNVTRQRRNDVAHNPVARSEPDMSAEAYVLVVQYERDGTVKTKELTRETIARFQSESKKLLVRFGELVPEARST
jgi:hypothetical protein